MSIISLITFSKVVKAKAHILVYVGSSLSLNPSRKDINIFLRVSLLVPKDSHFSHAKTINWSYVQPLNLANKNAKNTHVRIAHPSLHIVQQAEVGSSKNFNNYASHTNPYALCGKLKPTPKDFALSHEISRHVSTITQR